MVGLVGGRMPITRDNLVDKFEHNRRETENVTGRGRTGMRLNLSGAGYKKPGTMTGFSA